MRFYDLEIHSNADEGENTVAEIAKFAETMGYSGIAICDKFESMEKLRKLKEEISKMVTTVDVYLGVKIYAETPEEMRKAIERVREEVAIIIVSGGNYSVNRAACENSKVDILIHPELGRVDNGLDEVCLNEAKRNGVAIGINFREILKRYRRPRSFLLDRIAQNISLCKEINVPIVVCSGAKGIWDMRDPRKLVSITNIFGMELEKSFACVSSIPQGIVDNNLKKLRGEKITEGVELG